MKSYSLSSSLSEKAPLTTVGLGVRLSSWKDAEVSRLGSQLAVFCSELGPDLAGDVVDSVFGVGVEGATVNSRYLRASCPTYWSRRLRSRLRELREVKEIQEGNVGSGSAFKHCSSFALEYSKYKEEQKLQFLKNAKLRCTTFNSLVDLKDVVRSDQDMLAEYFTLLKGIEAQASAAGAKWCMLTLTLPGAYHAAPVSLGGLNSIYNNVGPKEANALLVELFNNVRANLRKVDVKLLGIRASEPHQDGTPHHHLVFCYNSEEELDLILKYFMLHFPGGLRVREFVGKDSSGKNQYTIKQYNTLQNLEGGTFHRNSRIPAQIQADLGGEGVGSASFSTYALKYVAKSVGVSGIVNEEVDTSTSIVKDGGSIDSVRAWREAHGVRALSFFGLKSGFRGWWAFLRSIPTEELEKAPSFIQELASIATIEKGGGIKEFMDIVGATEYSPSASIKYSLRLIRKEVVNRYTEKVTRVVGLAVTCLETNEVQEFYSSKTDKELDFGNAAEAISQVVDALSSARLTEAELSGTFASQDALVQMTITKTNDFFDNKPALSIEQLNAIRAPINASSYVVAGAGSGKTFLLVERVLRLLREGVEPSSIIVVMFTKASAESFEERLLAAAREAEVSTQLSLDVELHDPLSHLRKYEPSMLDLASEVVVGTMHRVATTMLALRGYAVNGLSYDELIALGAKEGSKYYTIIVDEAQDLSAEQWAWVDANASSVFAVGDYRQAIYAFRGSDASVFKERVATQDAYYLTQNYRSTASIVSLSNAISGVAKELYATTSLVDYSLASEAVSWKVSLSSFDQTLAIAERLSGLDTFDYENTVVLVRSNREKSEIKAHLTLLGHGAVRVLTIHESKGLEFENVILALGKRKPSDSAEDAREVLYTAVTRAISSLYITSVGAFDAPVGEALGVNTTLCFYATLA